MEPSQSGGVGQNSPQNTEMRHPVRVLHSQLMPTCAEVRACLRSIVVFIHSNRSPLLLHVTGVVLIARTLAPYFSRFVQSLLHRILTDYYARQQELL